MFDIYKYAIKNDIMFDKYKSYNKNIIYDNIKHV